MSFTTMDRTENVMHYDCVRVGVAGLRDPDQCWPARRTIGQGQLPVDPVHARTHMRMHIGYKWVHGR